MDVNEQIAKVDAYRPILYKVGWVLICVGLVDIGIKVYCIYAQTGYSSSFNIFAVIAAIFLFRGSLKAARIVSWFAAFFIAAFTGILIVMPFLLPFDLLLAYIRFIPTRSFAFIVIVPILMAILVWIYRNLTSAVVREAMDQARINHSSFWRNPTRGFWVGACLPLILAVFLKLFMGGDTADEARQRAAAQIDGDYKFYLKSLNMSSGLSGKHVHAVVIAYNDNEIRELIVEWSE